MKYIGKVWKFGKNVDTDQIIPSQYLVIPEASEMAKHAMEPLMPEFSKVYTSGDILVGGENFGCGSSREQAPQVLKELGVKVIIAPSFARIFFRNCINLGILVIEIKDCEDFLTGDEVEVDMERSLVVNKTKNTDYEIPAISDFLKEILNKGGLVEYLDSKK